MRDEAKLRQSLDDSTARPRMSMWGEKHTRKPMLLFRLSVVFLFRFDERRFSGLLLFQEPPRITRWPSLGPLPL